MKRADYIELRKTLRSLMHIKRKALNRHDYAGSRLSVQIETDAMHIRDISSRIEAIRQALPSSGTDPLGFRVMAQNWARRRSHTINRIYRSKDEAEMVLRRARWAARSLASSAASVQLLQELHA